MPLKSDPTYTLNFLLSFNDAIIDLQVDIKKTKAKKSKFNNKSSW